MDLNLGSVNGAELSLGYVGAYTGSSLPYELTSHGDAHPNSVTANAKFASAGVIEIGIVTDFDSGVAVFDWPAFSAQQLWRSNVDELDAVTVISTVDASATATLRYRVVDTGAAGEYGITLNVTEDGYVEIIIDDTPAPFIVAPLINQPRDQFVEFPAVQVQGIDAGVTIPAVVTGTDVEYAVNAGAGYGAFTAISTDVELGYLVKARIRTLDFGLEATGSLSIGSESSALSATTIAEQVVQEAGAGNQNFTVLEAHITQPVQPGGTISFRYKRLQFLSDFIDPQTVATSVYLRYFDGLVASFGTDSVAVTWPSDAPYPMPPGGYRVKFLQVGKIQDNLLSPFSESTAATVSELRTDFNQLLADLKASNRMKNS